MTDSIDPLRRQMAQKIAKALRDVRHKNGWSQIEAAERCGTSQSQYARYESGRYGRMTLTTMLTAALGMGLDIDIVITERKGAE